MMTIIGYIVGLGIVVWLISLLPIPKTFQQIVYVLALVAVIVLVLRFFGVPVPFAGRL